MSEQTITIAADDLRAIFDLAVNSMNFGSGFWDDEEATSARRVAVALGLDPLVATPRDIIKSHPYLHPFEASVIENRQWDGHKYEFIGSTVWDYCRWCQERKGHKLHQVESVEATG